jgi:hypothetical protein
VASRSVGIGWLVISR